MAITTQNDLMQSIQLIMHHKLDPKALSKQDQNLIVEYLRYEENLTISKIAQLLELHKDTVRGRLKKIDEAYRTRLIARGFDAWTVISELLRVKRVVQSKAGQKGDWGLVWRTELDTLDKLITLGLIKEYDPLSASQEDVLEGIDAKTLRKEYERAMTAEKLKSPRAKAEINA